MKTITYLTEKIDGVLFFNIPEYNRIQDRASRKHKLQSKVLFSSIEQANLVLNKYGLQIVEPKTVTEDIYTDWEGFGEMLGRAIQASQDESSYRMLGGDFHD